MKYWFMSILGISAVKVHVQCTMYCSVLAHQAYSILYKIIVYGIMDVYVCAPHRFSDLFSRFETVANLMLFVQKLPKYTYSTCIYMYAYIVFVITSLLNVHVH